MREVYIFLQQQGLNENESEVYLDVFKHGQAFASSIAARTSIDRTTVYSALKRLLKKGLIAQTEINNVKAYLALSPEIFLDKLDLEMEEISAKKKVAGFFVEEIKNLQKMSSAKPRVKIFEGVEAVKNLYKSTLIKNSEQKSFLTLRNMPRSLSGFLRNDFMNLKIKKNVKSKVIIPAGKRSGKYKSLDKKGNRETRIVDRHPFDLHAEVVLFGGKQVAIIDFHQQVYGLVIESGTFYKTMEALYDFIWKYV